MPMLSSQVNRTVRASLVQLGRRMRPTHVEKVRSVLSYLELGRLWDDDFAGASPQAVPTKFDLFELAVQRVRGQAPTYLEFGVYQGETLRWWSSHLRQPKATFVGFDSFEGLPETWRAGKDAGHFATGGPPDIDDDRISYQVGWFDATLPTFQMPEHDQLIVNVDSDLYSSAKTVLDWAEPYLKTGDLIYFDEFADRDHELRAFAEFKQHAGRSFTPVGYSNGGAQWLFEVD